MVDAADRIPEHYRRHAAAWAAARGKTLVERGWLERFTGLLRPGAAVLDIGCGSGDPIGRFLLAQGYEFTGVDSSPELLALFRENLPRAAAVLADMRTLDLGRRFAGLIAWDSLFHLRAEQQRPMFGVFGDHALPGAALLFTSGSARGEAIGSFAGDPLYHASLDPDEYRLLLDRNDFDVVAYVETDPDCGDHTVWLARRR